jgi:hypothetical protein
LNLPTEQKCPKLIDHRRAPADQAITDPVDTLQVQLIISLDRDKTHVLPLDGLRDRFCIDEVVLVRLHEWLYKLSWDTLPSSSLMSASPGNSVPARQIAILSRDSATTCSGLVKVVDPEKPTQHA